MNNDYEAFCLADPVFYDRPSVGQAVETYSLASQPAPRGWRRRTDDDWVIYNPEPTAVPTQGWKVHVSGRLDNAERILQVVWDYCVPRAVPFKFLAGPRVVLARNAKYAGRGGSGKLVTVYPRDDAELEVICKDLDAKLSGEPGPYILSDLRWAAGPVHVRYGGFEPRYCVDERGQTVAAIEDGNGDLVPDERGPVFSVPMWVVTPDFLRPHIEARSAVTVGELSYTVDEALHFSNGGGVYLGHHRASGRKVVLKEGRPHAGLSGDGADAVARLHRERDTLARLAGVEAVPDLLDSFTVGDHEFVVMEHVEGEALNTELVRRCPLLGGHPGEAELAEYSRWAVSVHDAVAEAIADIHRHGVLYGDLHMFNVIVRPTGGIALIDFEVAVDLATGGRPGLGAVGFAAPAGLRGTDIDRYALACLKLALFLPLEPLLAFDRAKAAELAAVITTHFPLPDGWLDDAIHTITGATPTRTARRREREAPAAWPASRESIARAIRASATPERDDRLFPGDIAQFRSGGLNLGYGAAGILYALDVTGAGRVEQHEDWLVRHAIDPPDGTRLGFYDGMHGVAYVLEHLGHHDAAMRVLDMCLAERWEISGDDLYGGLAGIGLNLLHFAGLTDDPAVLEAAQRATLLVADRQGDVESVPETSGGDHPYAGLLRGSAGRALLFIRMFEHTGEPALLDLALVALRQDLRRCIRREDDGQFHVDEGWRTMPYLDVGSVGIGMVLARYLAHRPHPGLAETSEAIVGGARALFYSQSGLFRGRAGMVLYLADRRDDDDPDGELAAQVDRLAWHALDYDGDLAFPGDQMLRLSMDLATGSAGVLLALGAVFHDRPVGLPFLIDETRERG